MKGKSFFDIPTFFLFGAALLSWLFAFKTLALIAAALGALRLLNRLSSYFPSPLATPIRWVHAIVFDLFALAALILCHPLRFSAGYLAPAGPPDGRPILLVHGYLNDSSVWVYHKWQLARAGFGPIYTINLGNPFRSIGVYAEKVAKRAERIKEKTGRSDLVLIGHSMGGLVSSWYALQLAPPGTAAQVITVGSPLDGTHVARIGLGSAAREMERDSDFVKKLRREIAKGKEIPFVHMGTRTDELVVPYTSAFVGGHPQFLLDGVGHISLLFSSRIAKQLIENLKGS